MNDTRIRSEISKQFRVAGVPPIIRHHCKVGPEVDTYSYRLWVPQADCHSTAWVWLGTREEMLKRLGFPPGHHASDNRYRFEYPGLPRVYFNSQGEAETYYDRQGGQGTVAVIRDRLTGKVVYPEII